MSYSYVTYTGDGTTQDYIVPFPYLKISDVKVTLDDAEQTASSPTHGIRLEPYASSRLRLRGFPSASNASRTR